MNRTAALSGMAVVGLIVGLLVAVLVATALAPSIADSYLTAETNCQNTTDQSFQTCGTDPTNETTLFDTTEASLIGLGPLFLAIGLGLLTIGFAIRAIGKR